MALIGKIRLTDRLARVTSGGRRIRELDGMRFIAILAVFVQHVCEQSRAIEREPTTVDFFSRVVLDSRIGVELFFVISGFILALPFAAHRLLGEPKVNLGQYYLRRVTRLEPPYLLMLAGCFAVLVLYWHESAASQFPHLLASIFYLHNVVYRGPFHQSTINPVAWSLEIEVQFYLLAPALASVYRLGPPWVRRTLMIAFAVLCDQSHKILFRFGIVPPVTVYDFVSCFAMGFLVADIYLTDWDRQPPGSIWADIIAIPGWVLLPLWFQIPPVHGRHIAPTSALPFLLLILVWASFQGRQARRLLGSSFAMTVGGMCYSIYLLHLPLIMVMSGYWLSPFSGPRSLGLNTLFFTLAWGVPVMIVSAAYFLLIEKPCMRRDWPRRLLDRISGRPVAGDRLRRLPGGEDLVSVSPPSAVAPLSENSPVP